MKHEAHMSANRFRPNRKAEITSSFGEFHGQRESQRHLVKLISALNGRIKVKNVNGIVLPFPSKVVLFFVLHAYFHFPISTGDFQILWVARDLQLLNMIPKSLAYLFIGFGTRNSRMRLHLIQEFQIGIAER